MITIYHLGVSQSDRIVWLMEELELPYQLEWFGRAESGLAPPEYKALHPVATAPVIRDGDTVLGESHAIIEYIINRHGNGRLGVDKDQPNYADYLYWMSFRDSLQANLMLRMFLRNMSADDPAVKRADDFSRERDERMFNHLEQRLGESDYLAGPEFTAADLINFFAFTTLPLFGGPTVDHLPNLSAYVRRVSQRPAYIKAMAIAGPTAKEPL
ncbi:MAG: glutathione S-transferase family protein [Porticoccaceae bacterium]|jgi:glutathione S-transferase